jgi:hypothetical protein
MRAVKIVATAKQKGRLSASTPNRPNGKPD